MYVYAFDRVALPVLMAATVVKGFGRGSKMLGIPTANMSTDELGTVLDNIPVKLHFRRTSLLFFVLRLVCWTMIYTVNDQ